MYLLAFSSRRSTLKENQYNSKMYHGFTNISHRKHNVVDTAYFDMHALCALLVKSKEALMKLTHTSKEL